MKTQAEPLAPAPPVPNSSEAVRPHTSSNLQGSCQKILPHENAGFTSEKQAFFRLFHSAVSRAFLSLWRKRCASWQLFTTIKTRSGPDRFRGSNRSKRTLRFPPASASREAFWSTAVLRRFRWWRRKVSRHANPKASISNRWIHSGPIRYWLPDQHQSIHDSP